MKHIIDDLDKNKYEAYTKEEVLEVIQEAISSGELPEEINGLVLTFKNPVDNEGYKIAFCTQAKYNELEAGGQLESNCYYYITDDTSWDDFVEYVEGLLTQMQSTFDARISELEKYPINVGIDSQDTTKSVDLSEIVDNGCIISACCEVTTSSSQVQQKSAFIHINDMTKPAGDYAYDNVIQGNYGVYIAYNGTTKRLVCNKVNQNLTNLHFTSIKLLAKW